MSELTKQLTRDLQQYSYRQFEEKTGISRGTLEHLVKHRNEEFPKIETLEKLATHWDLPLWRVIEMAGVDLGLSQEPDEIARQIMSFAERMPELKVLIHHLLKLRLSDTHAVIAYLKVLERQRKGITNEG